MGNDVLDRIRSSLCRVIHGKDDVIDLLLVGLLSGGHVLIEDVPGVGKTTLAKALARVFKIEFSRVQFTPDLLPADILGAQVLNPKDGSFRFHPGPIFTHILLADEINRASPRTQSSLLEAMNESQATVDGMTHPLPPPFFVVATQNPLDAQGTYPLPEAQLDRFLLRVGIGYPSRESELQMLYSRQRDDPLDALECVATVDELRELQRATQEIDVAQDVGRYLLELVERTREHPDLEVGASPRGALALFRAAQAHACLAGRSYASPHDVQQLVVAVLSHRVQLTPHARYGGSSTASVVAEIAAACEVPL